jgi:predicted  nucleic acid-binding Zn-ribbon protein
MEAEAQGGEGSEEQEVGLGVDRPLGEIDRAVNRIESLSHEVADLKQRNQELHGRIEHQERELAQLREDRDRLQAIYNENATIIDNKEDIQRKIDEMLSRLNAVNTE